MAIVSKKLNQLDVAYNNYCNAIKLKPDYAEAHNSCGVILIELKKNDDAIKSINVYADLFKNTILSAKKLIKNSYCYC